ncbi:MAG: glutamine-hydrolyzing carbamoyl-phosphate synthase small subunit [Myxococcota bacterium]
MSTSHPPGLLVLEDGRVFRGKLFAASETRVGEVVFNTAMAGYQEVLGDPSYAGQMVVMTYPMIGNYGIAADDYESRRIHLSGFIIKELSRIASNWRKERTLEDYLESHGVPGICGIDTRALVRHLRERGAMRGVIASSERSVDELVERAKDAPEMNGRDLARGVSAKEPYSWTEPPVELGRTEPWPEATRRVAVLDFGVKRNILRSLVAMGCEVQVLPAATSAEAIRGLNPDGILLSNGPGDPEPMTYAVETVKELLGWRPIFGICLGHQVLSLAAGAQTYKLKFGHHGANHPVMDLHTRKVEMTSQNHGFAVDTDSLPDSVELTHVNLNDNTCSGLRFRDQAAFSVQYHPEAAPGPRDGRYLFERFVQMMDHHRGEA